MTTTGNTSSSTTALFAWGQGEDGQLGFDDARVNDLDYSVDAPRRVDVADVAAIASGSRNSFAVTSSGETYAWGWNSHRATSLTVEECDELFVPTPRRAKTTSATRATTISAGGWHGVCASDEGVYGWGGNEYHQAGSNASDGTGAGGDQGDAPDRDWAPARHIVSPMRRVALPEGAKRVIQVSCGGMASFALSEDGRVWEWGQPLEEEEPRATPQLVRGCERRVVAEIAAGSFHLLLRTENGEVLSYGNGMYGQLGTGATAASDVPRVVETFGRVGVAKIAAGGWHSAAVTAGGEIYTWGRGEYGRLGHGDDCRDKVVPERVELDLGDEALNFIVDVSLGGSHSCALTRDGRVVSWGRATYGRLGRVVDPDAASCGVPGVVVFPPLPDGGRWRVFALACGGRHTLAAANQGWRPNDRDDRPTGMTERPNGIAFPRSSFAI